LKIAGAASLQRGNERELNNNSELGLIASKQSPENGNRLMQNRLALNAADINTSNNVSGIIVGNTDISQVTSNVQNSGRANSNVPPTK
jgi:hypothetical protein